MDWRGRLRDELASLCADDQLRELDPVRLEGRWVHQQGRKLINLGGNDYLALACHPRLRDAAIDAISRYGTGASASRLVSGHHPLHALVEQRFAQFKHAEAALLCPTGFMANLAVLTALARRGDLVCIDKLNHASLIDAAKASGAAVRVFPHCNYDKLERLLSRHSTSDAQRPRTFIVTDSVFSMDGDCADLRVVCDLAERYGAITVVDEAHATGVLGATGAGLCELQGVTDRVDVVISTAGKALGGLGGIITADREVIDTIVNRARSFIYTTAVPPAQAATVAAALDVLHDEPHRRTRLRQLINRLHIALAQPPTTTATPIMVIITGDSRSAQRLAGHLRDHGIFAPAIRPPTVSPGSARVRLSLRADLDDTDLNILVDAVRSWRQGKGRNSSLKNTSFGKDRT